MESTARHQTKTNKNKMLLWANCYAVENRVTHLLEDQNANKQVRAVDLPLSIFLPTQDDFNKMRERMVIVTARILVANLPFFEDCDVERHIKHQYSSNMEQRSRVVSY